jgi:D-glycero-D-manno-heptose 1,7-bisphosphate phosphatase
MLNPAVFLDRDGVINRPFVHNGKSYAPTRVQDFEIFPEIPEFLLALKHKGFLLVIVTNQPDVGNGLVEQSVVEAIHERMLAALPQISGYSIIDKIKVCYHSQKEGCDCRKPKPGMLLEAAKELKIDFKRSIMIGDRASDIAAGKRVNCRTVFVDYDYTESKPIAPDFTVKSADKLISLVANF